MQDLLSQLSSTLVIGLIVAGILALVIVVLLARRLRNRQSPPGEGAAPSLEGPIDYTSLPLDDEPRGWRERFARLSVAGKILAVLVPILALLGLIALALTLLPPAEPVATAPTLEPVTMRVSDATVIRAEPLTVDISVATSGIVEGAVITAEMFEDGEPFAWLNVEQARSTVRRDRVEIQAQRAENAPATTQGRSYTVLVRGPDNTTSAPVELVIPTTSGIADSFFGRVATAPTNVPTAVPTQVAPTAAPTAQPEPSPTVAPELPTGPEVGVANGGNVRRLPIRTADNVIGGINAGEQVQLIERTPNGQWYRVRTVRDELGWVSTSLLRVPQGTNVPVAAVVTVFGNGAVFERPDPGSTELDRVNRDEVVQLKQKSGAGDWYEVVNMREITGWVPAELLGIPPEVAATVPVAP